MAIPYQSLWAQVSGFRPHGWRERQAAIRDGGPRALLAHPEPSARRGVTGKLPQNVTPPKITPSAYPTKSSPRVWFESNVTPILGPNPRRGQPGQPDWTREPDTSTYLRKLGFSPAALAYDGTFNRVDVWFDFATGEPVPAEAIQWADEKDVTNHPDLAEQYASALARLHARPQTYYPKEDTYNWPVFIDIEFRAWQSADPNNLDDRRRALDAMMGFASPFARLGVPTYCYYWPPTQFLGMDARTADYEGELLAKLSGAAVSLYNWDVCAMSGGDAWFDMARASDALFAEYYKGLTFRKVAFICPCWNIYFPDNAPNDSVRAMSGQPIPLPMLKKQTLYLIDQGWDIFPWLGGLLIEPYKAYFDWLARVIGL
jgi:hypothetical protein